jgi:hypothetical protein
MNKSKRKRKEIQKEDLGELSFVIDNINKVGLYWFVGQLYFDYGKERSEKYEIFYLSDYLKEIKGDKVYEVYFNDIINSSSCNAYNYMKPDLIDYLTCIQTRSKTKKIKETIPNFSQSLD